MVFVDEVDERICNWWWRVDNLVYDKIDGINNIIVKDGEVVVVFVRVWGVLVLR